MFLGISHLLISVKSLNWSCENYCEFFCEKNILNSKEKKSLLYYEQNEHDIKFLKHGNKNAIELIKYNKILEKESNIIISLEKKADEKDFVKEEIFDKEVYYNATFNIEYIIAQKNLIFIKVTDIEKEIKFWKSLGFTTNKDGVKIISPLKHWSCEIVFIKGKKNEAYMDMWGVNTVSLLTNDIINDAKKTKASVFDMNLNNKNIKVGLSKRENYIIEILEVI